MHSLYKVQESIKDLPIKPTQVNSSKYTPYIRNQHVQNKALKPKNKTDTEECIKTDSDTPLIHRLSNGKTVKIEGGDTHIPLSEEDYIKMSSTELDRYYQDLSMGYIKKTNLDSEKITDVFEKIQDARRLSISKNTLRDFGFDAFMEHANIDDDDKFIMDVCLVHELGNSKFTKKKYGMELLLYTDKQVTNPEESAAFTSSGGYDPDYDDPPQQAVHSVHISRDNEDSRLDVHTAYTRIETDNPIKGAGVKIQADTAIGARNVAKKMGLNNVHMDLEAALTTGTYLWNTMGYDVSKNSREGYLKALKVGIDLHIKNNIHSEKEYQDAITKHKTAIATNTKLFRETGRTQHLIDNASILYNEIPGVQKAFKNHEEWYKNTISRTGAMFACEMNFNVNDTLESNDHLRRLNAKHIETFGKPMPW